MKKELSIWNGSVFMARCSAVPARHQSPSLVCCEAFLFVVAMWYYLALYPRKLGDSMKRDLQHVKHLLELIQAHADVDGVYYDELEVKWQQSGGNAAVPLRPSECNYLLNRCADAGFITIRAA
ncbi:hypothetical protein AUC61_13970 [Pseudomonas sp. S25]|uniref:Uncharacterized protein n=1 Tax=Pseudomonas maioricensis TaxID=1766623 RepID=A0ABS9ZJM2_9PSED|nr:hypothetical protein [Pseudomonas sp. S25]